MRKIKIIAMLLAVLMLIPAYGTAIYAAGGSDIIEIIEQDDTYDINIVNSDAYYGFAIANRKTAKAGDTVVIGAFDKE